MSGVHGSLWALFYALLRSLDALRPNFLHDWHGVRRKDEIEPKKEWFDVEWIKELIIAILSFHYPSERFPTGEVVKTFKNEVNGDKAGLRLRLLRYEFALKLDKLNGYPYERVLSFFKGFLSSDDAAKLRVARKDRLTVESLRTEVEEFQKIKNAAVGKDGYDDVSYRYDDFIHTKGVLVNVYESLLNLHAGQEPEYEYFDENFFEDGFVKERESLEDTRRFIELRKQSNSYALRSGIAMRWKFNRTKKLMEKAICCPTALRLVVDYELFLFKTSPCGVLHWIFDKTKSTLSKYNSRTMDRSKWEEGVIIDYPDQKKQNEGDTMEAEETAKEWGWNEDEEMPEPPVRRKRKQTGQQVRYLRFFCFAVICL